MLNMSSNIAVVIGILISLIHYSPSIVVYCKLLDRFYLPSSLTGPESLAFDSIGGGPYTGVSDGRILKYNEECSCFLEFAHISPDRYVSYMYVYYKIYNRISLITTIF
jgi:hypothetical protein